MLVGACALLWAICNMRNDFILIKQKKTPLLSLWLHIGSVRGPISSRRSVGMTWILLQGGGLTIGYHVAAKVPHVSFFRRRV
jgi:hypothetical protein